MYILDTSAIRGIGGAKLRLASENGLDLSVSTLSVLELASHLNDGNQAADYAKARGNFLKCRIPRMLNDPFWALAKSIGFNANPTRAEDLQMLGHLLDAVESSPTLDDLSKIKLNYPDGATALCVDIGTSFSAILAEEEQNFVSHIKALAEDRNLDPSCNGRHSLTSAELVKQLTKEARSLAPGTDYNLQARSFLATAPYFGYLLARLYTYANLRPIGESELRIDPNDCEDAYICLNLDLQTNDVLVTNDKGTIKALRSTFAMLNEVLPAKIPKTQVMNIDDFVRAIEA